MVAVVVITFLSAPVFGPWPRIVRPIRTTYELTLKDGSRLYRTIEQEHAHRHRVSQRGGVSRPRPL